MPDKDLTLLQGTLDFLILKTLSWGSLHGFGIARWIEEATDDVLRIEEGSLYPALHRLERRGLIAGEWRISESNRRAKFYRLTAAGERALGEETESWARFTAAVGKVVRAAEEPA